MDIAGIYLDKKAKDPLYYQLYRAIVQQIRTGSWPAGQRLPGKRTAAAQLGVSVNTVDEAYQMLAAEGYLDVRPKSGFVVRRVELLVPPPAAPASQSAPPAQPGQQGAQPAPPQPQWQFSFSTGDLDPALFPRKTWNRLFREVMAGTPGLFTRGEGRGDAELRQAISTYLRGYRGVQCDAAQVVVGAGLEVLTGMLCRLLAGKPFAIEDPGYPKVEHILQNMGVRMVPVPVDGEGIRPGALAQSGAQVAYVTPSHQFPTGGVMPVGRRAELLRWATGGARVIIEDDYDSEFRFDGRPLPCLQGLDHAGRVVYAGTFSRSLSPGLRAAYLVLPHSLMEQWEKAYGDYACTVSRPEQQTLARLMDEGHFSRSLNRVRAAYRRRRDALLEALAAGLSPGYSIENAHTGLYFVLHVPGLNALDAAKKARKAGLRVRALDEYRRTPAPQNSQTAGALVLGYGGLKEEDMAGAVRLLASVL